MLQQCREGTGSRQSKTVSGAENLSGFSGKCLRDYTITRFFSNPFKAGAVLFLLCRKSPYLEIPNEEHQPFSIAPHRSQNVVQGPGAINLECECTISGPIPHLRNPILQLNKIPGKLFKGQKHRSRQPASVGPAGLAEANLSAFCGSHTRTLSLSGSVSLCCHGSQMRNQR